MIRSVKVAAKYEPPTPNQFNLAGRYGGNCPKNRNFDAKSTVFTLFCYSISIPLKVNYEFKEGATHDSMRGPLSGLSEKKNSLTGRIRVFVKRAQGRHDDKKWKDRGCLGLWNPGFQRFQRS